MIQPTQIKSLAETYFYFLSTIQWDNPIFMRGIQEGKNKFLTNSTNHYNKGGKQNFGDYYSKTALKQINEGDYSDLVFEHMVPKTRYIQKPCEEKAQNGTLTVEFIEDLIRRYWKIAIITKQEDKQLSRTRMPKGWDGVDILARYNESGIELIEKDFTS